MMIGYVVTLPQSAMPVLGTTERPASLRRSISWNCQ